MENLGRLFNRHHTSVIASLKTHKKHTDFFSNGRRVNELYTKKFIEGSEILDMVMGNKRTSARHLKYRVVLYTNNPDTLDYYEIMSVKNMM